jgi:hypothetical protein
MKIISHPTHKRLPWDTGGRSDGRPYGDAHMRASGRRSGTSPARSPVASVRRRSSPAAFRVYGEEEYLAGVDAFGTHDDGPPVPVGQVQRHGLRRIACATALTGTVGAVGGVVGLAGLRAHVGGLNRRDVAQRVALSAHVPASSVRVSVASARPPALAPARRRAALEQVSHRRLFPRVRERRPLIARALAASASRPGRADRLEGEEIADRSPNTASGASAQGPSVVSQAPPPPAEAPSPPAAAPETRSEFGFER